MFIMKIQIIKTSKNNTMTKTKEKKDLTQKKNSIKQKNIEILDDDEVKEINKILESKDKDKNKKEKIVKSDNSEEQDSKVEIL